MTTPSTMWMPLDKYSVNLVGKLGQGTFGIVYMGKDNKKNSPVAVKQVEIKTDETGGDAMREIKNLLKLPKHENVVRFFDFHFSRNSIWMVMEYCDMGDLMQYYKTYKPIKIETNVWFMCQMVTAIAHMHSMPEPIVHRDLKPANILIKYCGDKPLIKVTDFGLAKVAGEDKADAMKTFMMTTVGGTPGYMAPELFAQEKYTSSVDVFAMGLIMLGMLNYDTRPDMLPMVPGMPVPVGVLMNMSKQSVSPAPTVVTEDPSDGPVTRSLKGLIKQMVAVVPSDRIKSAEAKRKLDDIFEPLEATLPPHPPPPPTADDEETSVSSGSDGSVGEGLGYHLLEQVARQHLEEQLKRRDAGDAARAAMEVFKGGMPFAEVLKALFDSDAEQDEDKAKVIRGDEFSPGDRVVIDDCGGDINKAKRLQENYGGWNERMKAYLGREGRVQMKVLHVVKVKFSDGNSWSFNPALVNKIGADGVPRPSTGRNRRPDNDYSEVVRSMFKRFDVVKIPEDEELVRLLQKHHGGWNDRMIHCLGLKALVNRVDKDGDVFTECINGDDWVFNPELLVHVEIPEGAELEPGDFILVRDNLEELQILHLDCGGWTNEMSEAVGHTAIVKEVLSHDRVVLDCRGQSRLTFHKDALKLVAKGEEMMVAILRRKMRP